MHQTVPTASGISIIDPKELVAARETHIARRQNELIVSLMARVNNAVANRVDELQKSRGQREIGAVVTVNCDTDNDNTINEVVRQLKAVGYAVKAQHDPGCYDGPGYSSGPSNWLEIYV
jgi:hypothetical protein